MKTLVWENFSGTGVYNQLFSLETGIYFANITKRKLILLFRFAMCHKGNARWEYGKFLELFNQECLEKILPYGFEVYYGADVNKYLSDLQNDFKMPFDSKIRFSNIGFIDKRYNDDSVHADKILKFLHNRQKMVLDIDSWVEEKIYISNSNASRMFYNFYTSDENYEIMSQIAISLTKLNKSILTRYDTVYLPKKYIAMHFRFGDLRHDVQNLNKRCDAKIENVLETLKFINVEHIPIYVTCDRRDTDFLKILEQSYTLILTEEICPGIDDVNKFMVEKKICENATYFVGWEGSTVSHHIQYVRFMNDRNFDLYTNRSIAFTSNVYSWNYNKVFGPAVTWKTFFGDNIQKQKLPTDDKRKMPKTKIVTLTNDGYKKLTHNLLISMENIGIEQLLTVYCIGKESYKYFQRRYPKNEIILLDDADETLNAWIEYKACQSKDADGKKIWADITSYKLYCVNEELKQGKNVLFVDGDIVFLKNPMSLIHEILAQDSTLEFIVQNDATEDKYEYMCTGFMWLRSNENTINITNFKRVRETIDSFQNDQQYMRKHAKQMKHVYFKLEDVPNGKYWREKKPQNPYIIHFNYDVSEFKIKRMKMYHKW